LTFITNDLFQTEILELLMLLKVKYIL